MCLRIYGGIKTNRQIPFWEKYLLTIEEAASYFQIGENKLRKLLLQDNYFAVENGNRKLIKRKLFEQYLDKCSVI